MHAHNNACTHKIYKYTICLSHSGGLQTHNQCKEHFSPCTRLRQRTYNCSQLLQLLCVVLRADTANSVQTLQPFTTCSSNGSNHADMSVDERR